MDPYQSAKEEIRRAADIVEVIGHFVQMKKAGQNFVGLCPFHSEKAPSFTVSPSRQMFHCFGCKKGGDIFTFWMDYHKVSFPQAMQDLADKYQIILPEKKLSPQERGKKELRELLIRMNAIAAEYFHGILTASEKGRAGRAYFEKRSIPKEIIAEYKLGYAPDEWDGLTGYLKKKNGDLEKAVQAGLIIPKKNGGHYDRFRGRVIFPIYNLRNQIVGFGGRVLDDALPKYLNTPETPVFRKGEFLYGLNRSHQPIRQGGRAVVVEGYTDVLALRKHGFHEAVATLGTALTKEQIRKLKGYAKEAVVVFDSDTAGMAAAIKSLSHFMDEGLSSRVMILPEGDDPDSYVNEYGLNSFLKLLEASIPMFDYYLDQKLSNLDDGVENQVSVLKEILPILSELNNVSQQSLYVRRLSEKMGIAEPAVLAELRNWQKHRSWKRDETGLGQRLSTSRVKNIDDLHLLNLFVHYPHTMDRLMNLDCKILLSDPVVIGIFDSMCDIYTSEGEMTPADILQRIEEGVARERFREVMFSSPMYPKDMVEQALEEFEARIHKKKMTESISRAKQRGDIEQLNQLLKQKGENPL
jgi:DNA primase